MRRLRSAAFKILALLEFGCSVQKHAIQTNGVNGDANPQTAPSAWGTWTPIFYTHAVTNSTHHPKRHPHPITRFATIHFPDIHTDRQTHRPTGEATGP